MKVAQSVLVKLPVFTMEAFGMEIVRALPEIVAVNRLPLVLVATEVTTEEETEMVEVCAKREVSYLR